MSFSHSLITHLPRSPLAALPWRAPLRKVPRRLQHAVLARALNLALKTQLEDGELDFLDGRVVAIRVGDLGYRWAITLHEQQIQLLPDADGGEAQISGDSREFLLLAGRRADPDTLFFQRRLLIEGDTELGLAVKNLIDAVDLDELPKPLLRALHLAADLAEAAGPRP